jgi:ribonuclease P protein component
MGSFTFQKEERIVKRADFINLNLHGKRYYTKNFLVILKKNKGDITRLGINVSKRVGRSVKRNRIKRAIREFFRYNKEQIPKGYDILVVALNEADKYPSSKVQEELGYLILKNDDLFS